MAYRYFSSIHSTLIFRQHKFFRFYDKVDDHTIDWEKQLNLYEIDVGLLETFCLYHEAWDYTIDDQRKESWRCMITHDLKKIWVEEDNKMETWPEEIRDFDPVTFGLEEKIQQSKTLIEQWFEMQMQMQCKYLTIEDTKDFILSLKDNLIRCRYAEVVLFKDQIDILIDMLEFLYNSLPSMGGYTESKEFLEYRNFVLAFSNNAACLTFLYWAKESNDEIATEMNIALCHMLHKIKPCAPHVTACFFRARTSNNVLEPDEDISEAKFVDFFFEHTVLEDDFLILRERLIFLLTFLIGAPHENAAAAEEDLICSQIYALFREDAYILLPISEMKKNLSNKKMLLSDFMIKIEVLNAKIIQLYCRPSDSWNILEAVKMNNISFASLERELYAINHKAGWSNSVKPQVHLYLEELRFLRLFLECFETWDDSEEETRVRLHPVVTSLQRIWGQEYNMGLVSDRLYALGREDKEDWKYLLDLELKEKFHLSKQEINAWLVGFSQCSFHCKPTRSNNILKIMDSILYHMSNLFTSGACEDAAFEKQIEILKEKLLLIKNLLKLITNCAYSTNLEEFNMLAQAFVNNAACLLYMYWANEGNAVETNLVFSNMLQNIKPDTPHVARIYIGALKAICLQPYDSFLLEQATMSFVDYFFEDLVAPWKNNFQILRDEVIFLLSFVHHHHHTSNAPKMICSQLDVLFSDGVYDLIPFDDVKGGFSEKKGGLSDYMMNIATENANIRQFYCRFPGSFLSTFPRIIGQGFLDCLIQKLRNLMERMISDPKSVPFSENTIKIIEEELLSLTPIFNQFLELKDLNDAWLEVVNVLYLAEHVISLCLIFYHLIRYYIPYLSDVVDRIKALRIKLEKIEECNVYNNSRSSPYSAGRLSTLLEHDWNSEMVCFEEDEKILMDNITRGTKSFDIVSIVGMGGLGKTTLAKKLYSSVKSHFNICAFTYASQDKRKVLIDILKDIGGVDANTSSMTEDDLAHKLKQCLSHQVYFIVMDDIWYINYWEGVRSSFPDDQNGSRVMFTTRSLEVAKRCQIKCSPHCLRFLTEDESWKLLQKKVFRNDTPSPNLYDVAKLVVKKCNGLPLAIVVMASLLARTETSLWIEISKRISSYLFHEGCMGIVELSYEHLPEYLKPCLLYLGAFPEDSSYKVREVTLQWIGEGFIKESKTKSLIDVAKEYLYELVDRSLIIVDKLTIGEIRTFRVHDLIHELCRNKCRDDNFCQQGHGTEASSFSEASIYDQYRVSMRKLSEFPADDKLLLANTRSLLYFRPGIDYSTITVPLWKFKFAQVLDLPCLEGSDVEHLLAMVNLRYMAVFVMRCQSIPSSISNLWNIQSLILRGTYLEKPYLPETLWRMKSLRHVEVDSCRLIFSDGYELNEYPQLDKVVSFSKPVLSSGKDVEWLLQRLPAVRELDCILDFDSDEEKVETFDFHGTLESLKVSIQGGNCPYLINFPSTLIKLTLVEFKLSSTAISAIVELQCLRILKLRYVNFPGSTWEMEDVTFPNLKYLKLYGSNLELLNASFDSFPCLEQIFFHGTKLEELPSCFGEISSLKKITIKASPQLVSSAHGIQEELMELGNKLELVVS